MLLFACVYHLVIADVDTANVEVLKTITYVTSKRRLLDRDSFRDKCRDAGGEELRKHCQIQELKKMEIKDAIMSHVEDVDFASGQPSAAVNQRLLQELLSKQQDNNVQVGRD